MNTSAMLVYMAVTAITPGPNNLMCLYLGATVKLKGARNFLCGSMTGLYVKTLLCGLLIVLQCLNAKSWISAISIFSVYVIPYTVSLSAILFASTAYLALIVISSLIWVFFGQAIQGIYKSHKLIISLIMGASLVVCAITALL